MSRLEEFWGEFRAAHDAAAARVDYVRDVKQRMPHVRPTRRRIRSLGWPLAAAALLGVAVSSIVVVAGRDAAPITFALGPNQTGGSVGEWIAAPDDDSLPLAFSDGTRVTIKPGSRARVVQLTAAGAHLIVERGAVAASVRYRADAKWLLDVGPFHIQVVGTRFDVDWEPAREVLRLKLDDGVVRVSGSFLKEPLTVAAGQLLTADCRAERSELVSRTTPPSRLALQAPQLQQAADAGLSPNDDSPLADERQGAEPRGSAPPQPERAADAEQTWKSLAARGLYREAFALIQKQGFDAACQEATAQERVALGDIARLAGHPTEARRAYLQARTAPGTSMAAYGLGLTAFDQAHNYPEAAKWFRTYLRERPGGALRREALGRLMEALRRSGDLTGARRVAQQYLEDYPSGTHAPLARRLIRP
jgi:transmembrane sensor